MIPRKSVSFVVSMLLNMWFKAAVCDLCLKRYPCPGALKGIEDNFCIERIYNDQ